MKIFINLILAVGVFIAMGCQKTEGDCAEQDTYSEQEDCG